MPELALQQQNVVDKGDVTAGVPVKPEGQSSLSFHREIRTVIDPNTKKLRKTPGRLSRLGMIQAINAGYHVQVPHIQPDGTDGVRAITKIEDIPSDAELAEAFGEESNVDQLQLSNKQKIEQLRSENDRLEAMRNRQRTAPKPNPKADADKK